MCRLLTSHDGGVVEAAILHPQIDILVRKALDKLVA
jgi:hypothetical protein